MTRKSRSPSRPTSESAQVWGWGSCEIVLASRSKRWRRSSLEVRCSGRTLTATVLSSRVSRARYTSPMPPAPIAERISYGPSLEPAVSVTLPPVSFASSLSHASFCFDAAAPDSLSRARPAGFPRNDHSRSLRISWQFYALPPCSPCRADPAHSSGAPEARAPHTAPGGIRRQGSGDVPRNPTFEAHQYRMVRADSTVPGLVYGDETACRPDDRGPDDCAGLAVRGGQRRGRGRRRRKTGLPVAAGR